MSAEFLHILHNETDGYSFQRKRIGFYSIDTDRKFHLDDRNLKYVHHVPPNRRLNLNSGYASYISKDWWLENEEKIDHIMEWLSCQQYIHDLITPEIQKVTFICSKGLLNAVMKTPYEQCNDWRICGTKVGSAIFLCTFFTDAKKSQRQLNRSLEDRKKEYMRFKFKQYLLSDSPAKRPDTSNPVNSRNEFCIMYRCQLNQHDIIFGSEVDGIDSFTRVNINHTDLTTLNSLNLIVLKTPRYGNYQTVKHFQNVKSLRWWTQSYLIGNKKIICGFRKRNSKKVTGYNYYDADNLPSLVMKKWHPHICINFLDDFFSFVKTTFQHESDFSKWRFDWQLGADKVARTKITDESEYNILTPSFIDDCKEILIKN